MTTQHIETLIIGAGQAGLATGYHLKELRREILILDGNARVGDNWRCHWDSLRLFTPAKYDGLPGLLFPGDPWSFPGKDDVADYLETYALEMELPVRLQTRVDRLEAGPGGGFTAYLGAEAITSDNVVVATGTRGRTPHVPEFAGALAQAIRQLHSTEYQRPSQLSDGPTLVVGASHSGCEIAYEVGRAPAGDVMRSLRRDRAVRPRLGMGPSLHPAVGVRREPRADPPHPTRSPMLMRYLRLVLTDRRPDGADQTAPPGRARRAMAEAARDSGVSADGRPLLADGTVLDVTTVIWCTGFEHHFEWIELPIFDWQDLPATRVPRRRRRGARALLLRACLPVRVQLDGAAGCRSRRRARSRKRSQTAAQTGTESPPDTSPPTDRPDCSCQRRR